VSTDRPPRGRKNPSDDSVEVWLDGRHLYFPADGGEPTYDQAGPPDDAGPLPSGVRVVQGDSGSQVRVGNWIVFIDAHGTRVRPAKARRIPGTGLFYRFADRRARND
jgi:hypothetical protein